MPRTLVWFRYDLRLSDNAVVAAAVKAAKQGHEVVPLFCFDDRFMKIDNVIDQRPGARKTGEPKMGKFRAQFLLESVNALKQALQGIGSDLFIYYDRPERVVPGLLSGDGGDRVLTATEVTSEELAVDAKVKDAIAGKASFETIWVHTLYHVDDLPYGKGLSDMPDTFTPFKNDVEKQCEVRPLHAAPQQGELPVPAGLQATEAATWSALPLADGVRNGGPPEKHPSAVLDFEGGEAAAHARLQYYLWDSDLLQTYFQTRNGMLGGDYSTKFSPWLALGCISPRVIYSEIQKYQQQRVQNKSTYWVIFELTWRDFYKFFGLKYGTALFAEDGTSGKKLQWTSDGEVFDRWKQGTTGMPLVDANMRELAATGFMSNRGRQNVASYLVLELGVDWRLGADWFEHLLIDHDVTSNWGNWVAAAGLTGGRINKFNITKQGNQYDEEGDYVRTWLPELADVPAKFVHEPFKMPDDLQQRARCVIGDAYPPPIPNNRKMFPQSDGGGGGGRGRGGGRRGRGGGRGGGRGRGGFKGNRQNAAGAMAM